MSPVSGRPRFLAAATGIAAHMMREGRRWKVVVDQSTTMSCDSLEGLRRVITVPVLLVAFNRPDRLRHLIDRLREVKPSAVYIAVDGPRDHVDGESAQVAATRAQAGLVDWPCEVRTLFRNRNLGCGRGVSGAISWLFENEERGIILEDDLLPDPSFFAFCDDLLDRYAADERVWAVSGCNFVPPEAIASPGSYRFATVPHIWGWATWRRSWAQYDFHLRSWRRRLPTRDLWHASGRSPAAFVYWSAMFDLMSRDLVDTWDVQAVLTAFADRGLTATANMNLVENVGFGAGSTHTDVTPTYLRDSGSMALPIEHPASVRADEPSDAWTRRHVLEATPLGIVQQGSRFVRRAVTR